MPTANHKVSRIDRARLRLARKLERLAARVRPVTIYAGLYTARDDEHKVNSIVWPKDDWLNAKIIGVLPDDATVVFHADDDENFGEIVTP